MPGPPEVCRATLGVNRVCDDPGPSQLLGAAAGFDALGDAGLKPGGGLGATTAVVFAICSGGVNYTRRFYHEIVTLGAHGASPLLFPETVYNAAASHLAALLGVNEHSYTLVGDSSVGLEAIHFATELLTIQPKLDRCLVVGTEEADWLLADAFASWRMATSRDQFEVYGRSGGTIFGEGAAAVLIGRTGALAITGSSPGLPFHSFRESESAARKVFGSLGKEGLPEVIVSSANGTFVDEVERQVFERVLPDGSGLRSKTGARRGAGCERFAAGCCCRAGPPSPVVAGHSGRRIQTRQSQPGNTCMFLCSGFGDLRRVQSPGQRVEVGPKATHSLNLLRV